MALYRFFCLILVLWTVGLQAQNNPALDNRLTQPDSSFAPFYHGVASGDPLSDRVIIWSRITLKTRVDNVSVKWTVATDPYLEFPVISGLILTDSTKDFTLKVDAGPLVPNTWYYYAFEHEGARSPIGRTRTLPVGDTDSLRFAVVSCQDYQNGFYNAYHQLALRNDVDAVFHLGDFIYENLAKSNIGRRHFPEHEAVSLSDYRCRYAQYKQDPDLARAMQMYPFICIWDDHEFANDAYQTGAPGHRNNHPVKWLARRSDAARAFHEWLPIRTHASGSRDTIYRSFSWGNLAETYFLEGRVVAREKQPERNQAVNLPQIADTNRRLLGTTQLQWLKKGLESKKPIWNLVANSVMVAPLLDNTGKTPLVFNSDLWDGYPAERKRFYDVIQTAGIGNLVILSGDQHTPWANDLPLDSYNTDRKSLGVEFVTTSISSAPSIYPDTVVRSNKHIRWGNMFGYGFMITDVNKSRVRNDFYTVSAVHTRMYNTTCTKSFQVKDGEKNLEPMEGCEKKTRIYPPAPPVLKTETGPGRLRIVVYRVFPFPDNVVMVVQYHCEKKQKVNFEVLDKTGKTQSSQKREKIDKGLHSFHFDASALASGEYMARLSAGKRKSNLVAFRVD